MIGLLKGNIAFLGSDYCLVDTSGGVGYRVFMPSNNLAQLGVNVSVSLRIHTTVREDAILLYGFLEQEDYDLFELLLSVSGVGPKMALGILSVVKPDVFYTSILNKDLKSLVKLPGVGKKTAERMLLELKDKVDNVAKQENETVIDNNLEVKENDAVTEAIEALLSLGYSNNEIMPIIKQIENINRLSGEEVLRKALKLFALNR